MAESSTPAAEEKAQPTPRVQPAQVTMVPISDAAPLSVPLRVLSVQQIALVLQQGRQKIEAMYEEKNRLGQEIATAQSKKRSLELELEIAFETDKSITRANETKSLEKHLIEQEITDAKVEIQLLDDQFKVLTKQKHEHMQEIRTGVSAKEKLHHEVRVLKDEKHQLEREMPGAKGLHDKLSQKTLAANAELNRLGQIVIEAKAEHDRVAQENHRLVQDLKRANAKKDRVLQEIQIAEREKERLMQDILAMTTAATPRPPLVASNGSTDQEGTSGATTDPDNVGRARSMTPIMIVVWVVLLYLFLARFPLLSLTALYVGLCILKVYWGED